ncbi:DUF3016 domain-containing protein [Rhodanobacter ginsengiterrae]|uniref:DUF3016 domain-containing protein n=1 Tax=Rhodanobacter ginsengiterrae TaxID=2008451 RepID=UPI003CECC224
MKHPSLSRLLCLASLALAAFGVQAQVPAPHRVSVHYRDPGHFTETLSSVGFHANDDAWLEPLKAYFIQRAERILAPGQRLDITVTDVDRAGEYEPWLGPNLSDVRIIKDIYPPRIDVDFTLHDAAGKVLRQGSRKLRDPAFPRNSVANDQDPLRYEKAVIDRWLRKGTAEL